MAGGPRGFGASYTDRAAWESETYRKALSPQSKNAELNLAAPFPAWSDEAYLLFSKTGSRSEGEAMLNARRRFLYPLVIAECLENRGRFVVKIEEALSGLAEQRSWVFPAHDRDLGNFQGIYNVDLVSSETAAEVAEALYLLGDKISPAVRERVKNALEKRVFSPLRFSYKTGKGSWWLRAKSNWNAVCLFGVTAAALTVLSDEKDRALFASAAVYYSKNYLDAFTNDGYSTEGAGYWNYGFSRYINLRETLLLATGGQVDIFTTPKVRQIALYGAKIKMGVDLTPPYGDSLATQKLDENLIRYVNRAFALGLDSYNGKVPLRGGLLPAVMMDLNPFPISPLVSQPVQKIEESSYFSVAGVMVSRPPMSGFSRLSSSFKAGGNISGHSHNDIGSYVVALNEQIVTGDPGGPPYYSGDFFGPGRNKFKVVNSFGHPVPVVAGQLQREASQISPEVVSHTFNSAVDEMVINLRSAYPVPSLKSLLRTLTYQRSRSGFVSVNDQFQFSAPQTFEGAIITRGQWTQTGAGFIRIKMGAECLLARIDASAPYNLTEAKFYENGLEFTRIGIRFKDRAQKGSLSVTYSPE